MHWLYRKRFLNSHFGSNLDPCYIQNNVIMNCVMPFYFQTNTVKLTAESQHIVVTIVTIRILSFWAGRSGQPVQTQIRMLLAEYCLATLLHDKTSLFKLLDNYSSFLGCPKFLDFYGIFEPSHDKTNKMTYAPSEGSDQPGHPPSLIRVFTVCSMGS